MNLGQFKFSQLVQKFNAPVMAYALLVGLFALTVFPYVIWVNFNGDSIEDRQKKEQARIAVAVSFQTFGYMQVQVDFAALSKYYRSDKLLARIQIAEEYIDRNRPAYLKSRQVKLTTAAQTACQIGAVGAIPPVLIKLAEGMTYSKMQDGVQMMAPCRTVLGQVAGKTEDLVSSANLMTVINWLREYTPIGSEQTALTLMTEQYDAEQAMLEQARRTIGTVNDDLSFAFLESEGYGWIYHLAVFSIIGVLMRAMLKLVTNTVTAKETGLGVLLVFPRLITAPVVAVVVVATIVYGLSADELNLSHNPLFIIFAFASGFMSESFTNMLKEGLDRLLPSIALDASQLKGAQNIKAYAKHRLAQSPFRAGEMTTLADFKTQARKAIADEKTRTEAKAADKITYLGN